MEYTRINEQTYHLIVSDRRRPWILEIPEALQVRCRPFGVRNLRVFGESGIWKIAKERIGPRVTSLTQRKRCFTSVKTKFNKDPISLRLPRISKVYTKVDCEKVGYKLVLANSW
uniref:SFRICE_034527 n=1 Tax=Spodoptera frugiperda TaxID=7108 RepID=A0A2H1V255_SPOFR